MDENLIEKIRPLLGTMPDARIADRFKVTRQRIGQLRNRLKIAKYKASPRVIPLCGSFSKKEKSETEKAAKKARMNLSGYIRKAIIEKNREVLGK